MENRDEVQTSMFYMIDRPSAKRQPGWPLDSISLDRETLTYFVDDESDGDFSGENIILGEYRQRLVNFLKDALGLTEEKP